MWPSVTGQGAASKAEMGDALRQVVSRINDAPEREQRFVDPVTGEARALF